jgi:putative addiction module component (TIGR02574 family)
LPNFKVRIVGVHLEPQHFVKLGYFQRGEPMSTLEKLLADAALLPVEDRIQLIDAIWETLPEESLPPLSSEWMTEIQRRSAEIDADTAETVSWEQVRAEAMHRLQMKVPDAPR